MKQKLPYKTLCAQRNHLRDTSKAFKPGVFVELPPGTWPNNKQGIIPTRALRSRDFLVQIFQLPGGVWRLSVNRAAIDEYGGWLADISWEKLQEIKRAVGFGDLDAVEVYPRDCDVTNVANMRHVFVLEDSSILPFIWRKH